METSDVIAFGLLLVTAISVIAAIWANARANANQKEAEKLSQENNKLLQENNRLNERLVVLEQTRLNSEQFSQTAKLVVRKEYMSNGYRLFISNKGPSIARNIDLQVHAPYIHCLHQPFPVELLNVNEQEVFDYKIDFLVLLKNRDKRATACLIWQNPSGEEGQVRIDLIRGALVA